MENYIERYSYWLGVACVVIAVVLRAVNVFGLMGDLPTRGAPVGYMTFIRGAGLLLLLAIATSARRWANK